ncbi:MAG TPA: DUF1592 domain-containing protein [Planctomycetota bacterium]
MGEMRNLSWCLPLLLLSGGGADSLSPQADDYGKTVQPLLAKYCHGCHGAVKPKAEVNLVRFTSEAAVRAERKLWKSALQMTDTHQMPPENAKVHPTPDDRAKLVAGLKAVLNKVDPKAPLDPGRVTVRRLNRVEYGLTVRELCGIDFDPAEDFPSDDIGHGFDNIGDVLTLSPVLMERYLAAAESIVERAFPATPPKVPEKHDGARYLEPAGEKVPQTNFRPLTAGKGGPIETGPLHKSYRVVPDGEHVFRFRAFAKGKGVKVAILAGGKDIENPASDKDVEKLSGAALKNLRPFRILETVEITATEQKKNQKVEIKIPPTKGIERVAVALLKGPEAEPPHEVHVESFVFSGPMDPRPAFQRRALAEVASKPEAERNRELLRRFATKAFRRPVTPAELDRLAKLGEESMQLALQAVLVSPKFLFRVELDDRPETPEAHPIGDWALASRLSYFLWSGPPDDELFDKASKGALSADLENQVRRMLKDPRSRALVDQFATQWLQLKRIQFVAPDGALFPQFNAKLRQSMLDETELFVEAVFREDRSLLTLIDADFTFLNERLARHYGIQDTAGNRPGQKPPKPGGQPIRGDDFVRVALQPGERGGLLSHASVLTVTSNPTRTSPVKRGRWVLEQILGTPPPPPPPDVPELAESKEAALTGSLRQRMEQHRKDPRCANCHAQMDAIGFALENYNAVGAWRTKDGTFDIDPAGAFPDGTKFKSADELKKVLLAKKDQFARGLAEKMLTYAIGRGMEPYDDRALDKVAAALAKTDYKFSTLILEIAKSDPFRLRRGKNLKE